MPCWAARQEATAISGHNNTPWIYVVADTDGRKVDIHVFELNSAGEGVIGPVELGSRYSAGFFSGTGSILGTPVRCIAPEMMVRFKTSYEPREIDVADVSALCARFNVPNPLTK